MVAAVVRLQVMGQYWSSRLAGVWGSGEKVVGYVYKVQGASGRVYIGSTTSENLERRLRVHECHWRAWLAGKSGYCSIYEILEEDEYSIERLETVKSSETSAVKVREKYYFDLFGAAVVNMRNPYRQQWEKKKQIRNAMRTYQRKERVKIRERVAKSNSTRVKCDTCNIWISRGYRSQHERTLKHLSKLP